MGVSSRFYGRIGYADVVKTHRFEHADDVQRTRAVSRGVGHSGPDCGPEVPTVQNHPAAPGEPGHHRNRVVRDVGPLELRISDLRIKAFERVHGRKNGDGKSAPSSSARLTGQARGQAWFSVSTSFQHPQNCALGNLSTLQQELETLYSFIYHLNTRTRSARTSKSPFFQAITTQQDRYL